MMIGLGMIIGVALVLLAYMLYRLGNRNVK